MFVYSSFVYYYYTLIEFSTSNLELHAAGSAS